MKVCVGVNDDGVQAGSKSKGFYQTMVFNTEQTQRKAIVQPSADREIGLVKMVNYTPMANISDVQLDLAYMNDGRHNVVGLRIKLNTRWNIHLLQALCESDSDREVCEYLTFGWPPKQTNRPGSTNILQP